MKKIAFLLIVTFSVFAKAQTNEVRLAYDYFRKGEYLKATTIYEELHKKNKNNRNYLKQLIRCYQEVENYKKSDSTLQNQLKKYPKKYYLLVEIGYNYQLQNQKEKAIPLYQKAIKAIDSKPTSAYQTGKAFRDNHLLDEAFETYTKAMELNPRLNFNVHIANIYGEKGEITKMFDSYLNMIEKKPSYMSSVKRYVSKFITDDSQSEYNKSFRVLVLKRLQNNPKKSWNMLLSWLFILQKDYDKALTQEKAIHNRYQDNLQNLFDLASMSAENRDFQTAKNTCRYIIDKATNLADVLNAENKILLYETYTAKTEEDYTIIEQKYKRLLADFGTGSNTYYTQVNYANLLVFNKNKPNEAIAVLETAKKAASTKYRLGDLKIQLADILVFTNKFNQALITYTQVQSDLSGSEIAQTARLKVAKTSYYKGDFDWAKTQLKVLKSATSKLISNDALKLNLLIGDNIAGDTIRMALKKYASADLLTYQNKNQQAIDTLSLVLKDFKGHAVEDEALFLQATLYKKQNQFEFAEHNYLKIIQLKKDGILTDDAYFELGTLYETVLNDKEKAKEMYEKIIFDYANSIFLVDARKRYRKLRGDILVE